MDCQKVHSTTWHGMIQRWSTTCVVILTPCSSLDVYKYYDDHEGWNIITISVAKKWTAEWFLEDLSRFCHRENDAFFFHRPKADSDWTQSHHRFGSVISDNFSGSRPLVLRVFSDSYDFSTWQCITKRYDFKHMCMCDLIAINANFLA